MQMLFFRLLKQVVQLLNILNVVLYLSHFISICCCFKVVSIIITYPDRTSEFMCFEKLTDDCERRKWESLLNIYELQFNNISRTVGYICARD